ncbi:putative glycosyltransferase [Nocardia brasiliensis NBRC 14402]|uniref:glycosyltransferase n=1 Tax=Nocardia brasiliensis TaxID=37326 RepID=UPI0002D663C9|nr:glycosyltransferase [Nocardia brasiliensis]ASF08337.1 glycosyltransferase family 4 protein [Nocardia brasiliensis]GAJ85575.1 putative glycosyltransferase [Nocardia brasiliensis NBRC 14402]SUB41200.1 D-inositol-3-phosphate glycosyltransferase [Nocardia brasiliensis]
MTAPRIGLVHERFTEYGGSEAVVAEFLRTWPGAAVFAPIVSRAGQAALAAQCAAGELDSIQDSWLSGVHAALGARAHAPLLPFVPRALRRLPLAGRFDAVLVSHHAFATQAVFATDAPVIAYVHSPARWAWDSAFRAQEAGGRSGQLALAALGHIARRAELRAAPRLAHVIANSHAVAARVRDWWGLPATVINPPVRIDRFTPDPSLPREDFFLFAGRLVPYKRADLAIRAARQAGRRLVVLGDGRHRPYLESIAGPETTFLGAASDAVLLDSYRRCQALLMPGVEDFGIVPVEAMACGTPVLAVGAGGALDTVLPGITGEHLDPGDDQAVIDSLARRMRDFDAITYDPATIRTHATTFTPTAFRTRLAATVTQTLTRGVGAAGRGAGAACGESSP